MKKYTPEELIENNSPKMLAMQKELNEVKNSLESFKVDIGLTEGFFNNILSYLKKIDPPKQIYTYTSNKKHQKMSVVIHFTDWHIGEVVIPDEIENFNNFNPEIAHYRIHSFCDKVIDWVTTMRSSYVLDDLVIIWTGDFVCGDIHQELVRTAAFPVPVQACEAGKLASEAILKLAPHFKTVRNEFVVPDNHGRLTKKVQFKEAGLNSFNYIVGWIAKQWTSVVKNNIFNLHTCGSKVIDVQGFRYLASHGHEVRGWSGFPYYGIDRKTGRESMIRLNKPGKEFNKLLIGHFHAPLRHQYWTIGGSLSGTNELDHAVGREAKPCQTAWFIHPTYGEVNYNEFTFDK